MTSTSGSEEIGLEKQDVWIYVCILLLCLDRAMDPDYVAGALHIVWEECSEAGSRCCGL